MAISQELLSQFAKLVNKDKKDNSETTVYGTIIEDGNGNKYVKLDGSDQLTTLSDDYRPSVDSTTANANVGERVSVLIKNHTATITGNVSSPAARTGDVENLGDQVSEIQKFDILIGNRVEANEAYIKELQADRVEVGEIKAAIGDISKLTSDEAIIDKLIASEAEIETLKSTQIDTEILDATYATIDQLKLNKGEVFDLKANNLEVTNRFIANEAEIETLKSNTIDTETLNANYANIDFTNIGTAAIEKFFAQSGMIENLVVGDHTVAGHIVGVTIDANSISTGQLIADRIVVKGEDGIYYKLNIEAGVVASAEITEEQLQNGLHGDTIIAKTITAEKVNVNDLVAFGATIGGFHITADSLYSGTKETIDNTTRGIYLDNDGQFCVGDSGNFLKFFKDDDGVYKLAIRAQQITFGSGNTDIETAIDDINTMAVEALMEANSASYVVDAKRRVFTETPTPPYDAGDLWVEGETGDIKVCQTSKGDNFSDQFDSNDWVKASKYTDDTVANSVNAAVSNIQNQLDGSITTWFHEGTPAASNYPASDWGTGELKNEHLGDIFYSTNTGRCYRWEYSDTFMQNFLVAVNTAISDMRDQIDGSITVWFYDYIPNTFDPVYPESSWLTTETKNAHLGDLFYNTSTGKYYRWEYRGSFLSGYNWYEKTDSAVAQALADVSTLQDTAANKRRVFFSSRPTPPYDVGDLIYIVNSDGNAYYTRYCKTSKTEDQSYSGTDWDSLTNHEGYHWHRIGDQSLTSSSLKALQDASIAQDTADGKRRVFTVTPFVPYDAGDLWVEGETGDIKVCQTSKTATESYSADDWVKASKYTDDTVANSVKTSLDTFVTVTNSALANMQDQIDGSITTWFYTYDPTASNYPASSWNIAELKNKHLGDLFYNTIKGHCYRWQVVDNVYSWQLVRDTDVTKALADAKNAQDTADNKRRVFYTTTPTPPYDPGDLWAQGASGDLMRCQTKKTATQSYAAGDWVKASKYTDDTVANSVKANLDNFVTTTNTAISTMQRQIDGSTITWFSAHEPNESNYPAMNWTTDDLKEKHLGDLYYNTATGHCYVWYITYSTNTYHWELVKDPDVAQALQDASIAQDTADGKRRVFTVTPFVPYDAGDLWVEGETGDIKVCQTSKTATESYSADDWVKASKYTDDTVANNAQSKADEAYTTANEALLDVNTLEVKITSLVRGKNGETLMTQTEDGWIFDMSKIIDKLDSASASASTSAADISDLRNNMSTLESDINNIGKVTAHISATQNVSGQPQLELSASNNAFRVVITNTSINFMDGSDCPAYISNKKLNIDQAQIDESLSFPTPSNSEKSGEWIWKTRSNGNYGLTWKELT